MQFERVMGKHDRKVGGGEGLEGVYGTLVNKSSMWTLRNMHPPLGPESILLDVGSGLGRPLMKAMYHLGVKRTIGIEMEELKVFKAKQFVERVARDTHMQSTPEFILKNVATVDSLGPATHVLAVWYGWDEEDKAAVGRLFTRSPSAKCIVIVQAVTQGCRDILAFMNEMEFEGIYLLRKQEVSMPYGKTSMQAYVFCKEVIN